MYFGVDGSPAPSSISARSCCEKLDLSKPRDKEQHDTLVDLVRKMLALTEKLRRTRSESERRTLQNAVTVTDKGIDRLVYDLYGLTAEEIAIVDQAIIAKPNGVSECQEGGPSN